MGDVLRSAQVFIDQLLRFFFLYLLYCNPLCGELWLGLGSGSQCQR